MYLIFLFEASNLELDISTILGFAIFPNFQNFYNSGNMVISTFLIDNYLLLFSY